MIRTVVIYARVSTKRTEQDVSLEEQQRRLRVLAERKGWTVVGTYVERHSAWKSGRQEFEAMLAAAGRQEFDAILVTARDRWARNLRDSVNAQYQLGRLGIQVHDERSAIVADLIDYEDPDEEANRGIDDIVAQKFSRRQSDKVHKGIGAKARERGFHVGDVPFGYSRPDSRGPLVPDPAEAPAIRALYERHAMGAYSLSEQAAWLNAQGLHPHSKRGRTLFTKSGVKEILCNPVYVGDLRLGDEVLPGQHEAIVSRDLFADVQARRRVPYRARNVERIYLLSGIGRHSECGAPLWGDRAHGRTSRYRCSSRQLGLPGRCERVTSDRDAVDAEVGAIFERIVLPAGWPAIVSEQVEALRSASPVDPTGSLRRDLEEKVTRARRALLEGLVPYQEAAATIRAAEAEIASLAPRRPPRAHLAGEEFLSIHALWPHMTAEERRSVVRLVLERVEVDLRGPAITGLVPRADFEPLFAAVASAGMGLVRPGGVERPNPTPSSRLYIPTWDRGAA